MKAHHCTAGAARSGYLDVLKWLCSQGCTLDGTEYYEAACGHHLHVLRWLHAQRAPIPTTDRSSGYRELRAPILIFLGDLGIPLPWYLEKELLMARWTFCTFHELLRMVPQRSPGPQQGCPAGFWSSCTMWLRPGPPGGAVQAAPGAYQPHRSHGRSAA